MGLFGFNERDYKKNTEAFRERLESLNKEISEAQASGDLNVSDIDIGKIIDDLLHDLDEMKFEKEQSSDYSGIDKRIIELLV